MPHPVTYYARNEAIDSLAEKYGPSFDRMTRAQKLQLLRLIVDTLSDDDKPQRRSPLATLQRTGARLVGVWG